MSKIRYFNGSSWKEIGAKETCFVIERGDTTAATIESLVYALDNGKPVICVGTAATYDEGTVYVAQVWDDDYKTVKFTALDDSDPPYLTTVTLNYTPGSVQWESYAIQLQTKLIDYGAEPNFKTLTINGDEYSMLGGGTINIPTGGGGDGNILWCTYDVTEFSDIYSAWTSGTKSAIMCQYGSDEYVCYCYDSTIPRFIFASVTGQYNQCKVRFLFCDDYGSGTDWATDDIDLQKELVSGTNIKTINGNDILGSGDIATKELYECTFSALGAGTTFAQVGQALTNGKIPYVKYDDGTHYDAIYFYAYSESGVYTFTTAFSDAIGCIYCYSNNTWLQSSVSVGRAVYSETVSFTGGDWTNQETSVIALGTNPQNYDICMISAVGDPTLFNDEGIYVKTSTSSGLIFGRHSTSSPPGLSVNVVLMKK